MIHMSEIFIECRENGPFRVKGVKNIKDEEGNIIPAAGEHVSLCRCGKSKKKPLCDGSHRTFEFDTKNKVSEKRNIRKSYVGKKIVIHDNRKICSHAGYCVDELPSVWKKNDRPWIDPDGASLEEIIKVIKKCPSGALSYSIENVEYRDPDIIREPEIITVAAGPYEVTGGIELKNAEWEETASKEHYALCRCGHSENKPFCDGAHENFDF